MDAARKAPTVESLKCALDTLKRARDRDILPEAVYERERAEVQKQLDELLGTAFRAPDTGADAVDNLCASVSDLRVTQRAGDHTASAADVASASPANSPSHTVKDAVKQPAPSIASAAHPSTPAPPADAAEQDDVLTAGMAALSLERRHSAAGMEAAALAPLTPLAPTNTSAVSATAAITASSAASVASATPSTPSILSSASTHASPADAQAAPMAAFSLLRALPPLRPYQEALVRAISAHVRAGRRRVCVYLPTGGGKTRVAMEFVTRELEEGGRVLIVQNRDQLVVQMGEVLEAAGLADRVAYIKSGMRANLQAPIQVASIQSLSRRKQRPRADLIIIDEAHCAVAPSYLALLEQYELATVLGLTATPTRLDPTEQLSAVFNALAEGPSVRQLIDERFLVPPVVYSLEQETAGVVLTEGQRALARKRTSGGATPPSSDERARRTHDLLLKALSSNRELLDTDSAVDVVVRAWRRWCEHRQTICFASSVSHSQRVRDRFQRASVAAEHVDGDTPAQKRADIFARFRARELTVITSVGVLCEGFDEPSVSCVALMRPTESKRLYLQQVGRGLRTALGKKDCVVLDQVGNTWKHGAITAPLHFLACWGRSATALGSPVKRCRSSTAGCGALVHAGARECDNCGMVFEEASAPAPAATATHRRHAMVERGSC